MLKSGGEGMFKEFVGRLGDDIRRAWDELPKGTRRELAHALGLMPRDLKGWRGLIDQAVEQVRLATGDKQQVAIVGPTNVGKSTLYNMLIRSSSDRARVSAVPGTTRIPQQAEAGLFVIIDTPGADAVGAVGVEEKERALAAASRVDLLMVLFDATHGIRAPEKALFDELMALGKPTVVALNKIDLVTREKAKVLGTTAATLGLDSEQLIPLSAKKGQGIDRLLLAVAKSEPGIVAALGAALPEYRWKLAQTVIGRAASTAAAIAVTPLPFLDFFPLVGIQTAMVLGVARIYAYKITLARMRELISTFGIGLLGRTLFYELSKFGGPPGWLVASGVAAGTTFALGYASIAWFDRGERLSRQAVRRISRVVSQAVTEQLKNLGRRKPQRITLRQRVKETLDDLPDPEKDM
ncbi:MAG: GTP-binding protein [Anaerolineales bacterium]|nr:MAG: GTP-binding protein [Anaerolineales bacterium]